MLQKFKNKYLIKSVTFKELPDDLQTAIIQKIIAGIFYGILLFSAGVCSKNMSFFLLTIILITILLIFCVLPYYLATRDLLIQITGIGTKKDSSLLPAKFASYLIYIDNSEYKICINVKKRLYKSFQNGARINVYTVPRNIYPNTAGIYMITNPLFVTIPFFHNE